MYVPQFPYTGNQVIISSGRVVHHSYDDFVFLFGKKGVSISSPATFTVDANERTILVSPKIELGYQAEKNGDPILLGAKTVKQLGDLLDAIKALSDALAKMSEKELETSIPGIVKESKVLSSQATRIKSQLKTTCLSKSTFTN
jgi:hypothetical protein